MAKKSITYLTKEDITAAINESQDVKENYPAFWKFYEMLLDMNQGLLYLQESIENDKKRK